MYLSHYCIFNYSQLALFNNFLWGQHLILPKKKLNLFKNHEEIRMLVGSTASNLFNLDPCPVTLYFLICV